MLIDLASNALAEHFTEGLAMSRATLIRLTGGLILVSVVVLLPLLFSTGTPLFTVGPIVSPAPNGGLPPSGGSGPETFFMFPTPGVTFPLVAKFLAACCFALGLLGVTLVQRGWIGRLTGSLALLGQIGMVLFTFLELWSRRSDAMSLLLSADLTALRLWSVLPFVASLTLGLGLIGCGYVTFKMGRFAFWRGALLVLGLWLVVGNLGLWWLQWMNPLLFLEGEGLMKAVGSFSWIAFGFTLFALISYGLWGWLGFTLWWQKPPREAQSQVALG